MANVQYYDVILKPVITEKSMADMATKKYTFLVHPEANKSMIKEAVEKMFEGTKVAKVNTMNSVGKKKRSGRVAGMYSCPARVPSRHQVSDRKHGRHPSQKQSSIVHSLP